MGQTQKGDRVRVRYCWPNDADASSIVRTCDFIAGGAGVFDALSQGVVGMAEGDTKRLDMNAREARAAGRAPSEVRATRADIRAPGKPRPGRRVFVDDRPSGRRRQATVVSFLDPEVVVRFRTPLAHETVPLEILLIALASRTDKPGETRKTPASRHDLGGEG